MNLYTRYLAMLAMMIVIYSCSKEDKLNLANEENSDVAILYLGPILNDVINSESTRQQISEVPSCSDEPAGFAQVVLTYGNEDTSVEVILEILEDENGLFTAYDEALEIPIPSGETTVSVSLNEFLVWTNDGGAPGEVIWAAPKTGSDFAGVVTNSLPYVWDLRAGSKTYKDIEVLCFDARLVNEYGYVFFDINQEIIYDVCFFVNYCTDSGRHYVANYSLDIYYGTSNEGTPIYSGEMPVIGEDGEFFADPICLAIPFPQNDEAEDKPYLYYEATLLDWDENYGPANGESTSGTWTWNDIQGLQNNDGETSEYFHAFINCDDDGEPIDSDQDGIPDNEDNCTNTSNPDQADEDEDGIGDLCDNCPSTPIGETVDEKGCADSQLGEDTALACADGIDNDGDGLIDCEDPDCQLLNNNAGCETCLEGGLSFADVVLEYENNCPDGNILSNDPNGALGAPDYSGNTSNYNTYTSLGNNGFIKLGFTNNTLTNSGDDNPDYYVFEIGPLVEASLIELRPANSETENILIANSFIDSDSDGYYNFGEIGGATAAVDIDGTLNLPANTLQFDAIKITSKPSGNSRCTDATPGADIDAVCALSSI